MVLEGCGHITRHRCFCQIAIILDKENTVGKSSYNKTGDYFLQL